MTIIKIFRLIPTQYIEDFYKDGSIRLTNIKKWRTDENKAIEDKKEGYFNNRVIDSETGATSILNNVDNPKNEILGNFYGMSFTMEVNLGTCVDFAFDGFWINDIILFANVINEHILCHSGFFYNKCNYVEGGYYQRYDSFRENGMLSERGTLLIGNGLFQMAINNQNDPNHLFTKDSYYSDQQEFRIIWETANNFGDYLYLKCPELRQLCYRINGINYF